MNFCIIIITDVHISLHATVNVLLFYYLNLLSYLLCSSIFLVYISCFSFFFIRFNFPTTFFKRRLLKFIIFFRCEKFYSIVAVASGRPNCIYRTYDYYAKRAIRLFHGTFSIVFLYTQSFHFLTYHWIRKWLKIFPNDVTYSFQQSEYSSHLESKWCIIGYMKFIA